jgi:hypothetical protein
MKLQVELKYSDKILFHNKSLLEGPAIVSETPRLEVGD